MSKLNSVKLHSIIGTSTVWTDEAWNNALTYLLENTSTIDAIAMTRGLGPEPPGHTHKIDYLREFRSYPPTVLLGAFDMMRAEKVRAAEPDTQNRRVT